MSSLGELVAERSVLVCCGSGGVGKTTVAASIALRAASEGRRTCVVTIDPAKRLADALGLASLTNTPSLVGGDWSGELWAMMLDTKATFDELIVRYSGSPSRAEAILANRIYRDLSTALSGTQEYMASEKLYQLHADERFDLVVVDTPPTRNALDFIEAPRRLVRFLDNRVFRMVMAPTKAYLRVASVATRSVLRTMSKVVGSEVVDDVVDFFGVFEGMEDGFRSRAAGVTGLLCSPETAFALVASPRSDAVSEALYLADQLDKQRIPVAQVVVNRMHPRFDEPPGRPGTPSGPSRPSEPSLPTGQSGQSRQSRPTGPSELLAVLEANLAELRALAESEEASVAALAARLPRSPLVRVPVLAGDVHSLSGLAEVADLLFGGDGR